MVPEQLEKEIENLRENGYLIELIEEDGFANTIFHDYPVPSLYNKTSTTLLIKVPLSYPNGRPDMFWTDEELLLSNGEEPNQANVIETSLGKRWRRFSWHPQAWNPASGVLDMYLEFVNLGLFKAAKK